MLCVGYQKKYLLLGEPRGPKLDGGLLLRSQLGLFFVRTKSDMVDVRSPTPTCTSERPIEIHFHPSPSLSFPPIPWGKQLNPSLIQPKVCPVAPALSGASVLPTVEAMSPRITMKR